MRGPELLREIEQGNISPLYFLYGEEDFLIEKAITNISQKLLPDIAEGGGKGFSPDIVYGREGEAERIINLAQTLPLFSSLRLILVKEADKLSPRDLEELIPYLENPSPNTCLIFWGEKVDLRTKFHKRFKELGRLAEFRHPYESELPFWIRQFTQSSGKEIKKEAVDLLIESVGRELQKLYSELEKVVIYIGAKRTIELEDIEAVVVFARIRTIFELTDWLGNRDVERAWEALARIWEEGEHPLRILAMIARQFRLIWRAKQMLSQGLTPSEVGRRLKLKPFFLSKYLDQARQFSFEELRDCFERLYQVDLKLKSSRVPPRILLEKLVLDFCQG